jgi:hypothetical protein
MTKTRASVSKPRARPALRQHKGPGKGHPTRRGAVIGTFPAARQVIEETMENVMLGKVSAHKPVFAQAKDGGVACQLSREAVRQPDR